MFGVGLHFSLKDLLSVRAIALPGAVVQIAVATVLGLGLAVAMGWTAGAGFVFGLALSVASTVVLLRAMQERHLMETERGRSVVTAQVPLAEVQRYTSDLRSMTGGRGVFSMIFSHYENVPPHVAEQVIATAKQAAAEAT